MKEVFETDYSLSEEDEQLLLVKKAFWKKTYSLTNKHSKHILNGWNKKAINKVAETA